MVDAMAVPENAFDLMVNLAMEHIFGETPDEEPYAEHAYGQGRITAIDTDFPGQEEHGGSDIGYEREPVIGRPLSESLQ